MELKDLQFITDGEGERLAVIVPMDTFKEILEHTDNLVWYKDLNSDETRYPNEVVNLMSSTGCRIQKAWRIYRRMTQTQVAEALGISQASVSEMEGSRRLRSDTAERLAKLYNCEPEQLVLD